MFARHAGAHIKCARDRPEQATVFEDAMKIQICARDVKLTKALRAHVELRLGFALSRFGEHIGRVAVQLSNSEESRDHREKHCRIAVGLRRWVKVHETDADVFAAVNRAADRAARAVAHAIEQEHERLQGLPHLWINNKPKPPAALRLRATRKVHLEQILPLTKRHSPAPLRKSQSPLDA
jgi:putative sigma-54 modulation protein